MEAKAAEQEWTSSYQEYSFRVASPDSPQEAGRSPQVSFYDANPADESAQGGEDPADAWNETRPCGQTTSGWRPAGPRLPSLSASQSAPLLSASWSPPMSKTFHSSSSRAQAAGSGLADGLSASSLAPTAHGKVPRWGRGAQLRCPGVLERELTWAYYRLRQAPNHPMRKEVGEFLPLTDVVAEMRRGEHHYFRFWRDARPPFRVTSTERVDELKGGGSAGGSQGSTAGGSLYKVAYECGIEYASERTYGETASESTYNNLVRGVATMRISDSFPKSRQIDIVSWGKPRLIEKPEPEKRPSSANRKKQGGVPSNEWSPLAAELGLRPNDPRLARCRRASEVLAPHEAAEVDVVHKILLGRHTHTTLPRLAHQLEERSAKGAVREGYFLGDGTGGVRGTLPSPPSSEGPSPMSRSDSASPKKKREHRVWTQAAGFVSYLG